MPGEPKEPNIYDNPISGGQEESFPPAPEMPEAQPEQPKAEMPEDFIEPEGESGKWGEVVENKELGVSYREKVIVLPKHRQEETGIKRIRRREVTELPDRILSKEKEWYLRGYDFKDIKNWDVLRYLTDDRFPSLQVWNHTLMGDLKGNEKLFYQLAEKHGKELVYFQDIAPLDVGDDEQRKPYKRWTFLEKHDSGLEKTEPPATDEEREKAISYYNMSVGVESWLDQIQTPIYVFGNKNKAFVHYLESILHNPGIKEALSHSWPYGWKEKFDKLDLADQKTLDYWANLGYLSEAEREEQGEIFEESGAMSFDSLRYLIEGKKIMYHTGHPCIPVVRHPDIPELRWCHAEMAIVPTKKNLNVLFFETDETPEHEEEK
jgi:hypothetical protein